jgi:hypothetical protein
LEEILSTSKVGPILALIAPSPLGTFWLKIEQFWPFEEISIFSNGGYLGYRTVLMDTISTVLYPRWSPLLKIEISSKGQNCSILSQKVPKGLGAIRTKIGPTTDTLLKGDHLSITSAKFG